MWHEKTIRWALEVTPIFLGNQPPSGGLSLTTYLRCSTASIEDDVQCILM